MDFGTNNSYHLHNHHHAALVQQNGLEDTELTLNQTNNNEVIEREHMFDKVVTPSDVGKLNRLVIPKQHAEKYFPLDSSSSEKGLLLNFEDRIGKPWRFRYSYWNSSQSYVMTKGWSRFVKDKKLDAGDVVSFHRGVGEFFKDRLFIDWRRRVVNVVPPEMNNSFSFHHHRSGIPWNPMFLRPPQNQLYENSLQTSANIGSLIYLRSTPPITLQHEAIETRQYEHIRDDRIVFESIPVVQGEEVTKTLRLFGVNMERGVSSSSSESSSSRLYNEDVVVPFRPDEFINKGKSSSMCLDFDI